MDNRVGVVVLGFGRIGQVHTRSLIACRRAHILYIVEELDDKTRKLIAQPEWNLSVDHGTQVVKPSETERVLSDPRVKAVFICLPTGLHESAIELVAKFKKHIFCDKPIAITVEGTARCYAVAQAAGVTLFCALNRRFDPAFVNIKKQVASGRIGKLQLITALGRDHPEPPEDYYVPGTGSMFVDMGIHNFDLISWVAGEYPIQVTALSHAHKEAYKSRGDFDVVAWMLKYPSGLIAYVDGCRYAPYGYDQRVEVVGTKGALLAENQRDDEVILRTEEGDTINPIQPSFPERYQKSYYLEVVHFLDVVEGKAKCAVSTESVINGIKAAKAAEESCATGKVVNIATSKSKL